MVSTLGVDREGEADHGAVEGPVELELAHDAHRAADGIYLFAGAGDDYVALRRAHRLAGLRGDHARLHASRTDRGGDTLPDALREIQAPVPDFVQAANLSKKRAK
jgi:hypothetical protein